MTIRDMITKYKLSIVEKKRKKAVMVGVKPQTLKASEIQNIKNAKPEIIEELLKIAEEKELAAIDQKQSTINTIKNNEKAFDLRYYDGEYLSGYAVYGEEAEILIELGLAKDISGWGCIVDNELIEALGTEFNYSQVVEYVTPKKEVKEVEQRIEQQKETERIENIITTAKATGERQVLKQYTVDCNDPHEECNTDIVTVWVMPDGGQTKTRQHTW